MWVLELFVDNSAGPITSMTREITCVLLFYRDLQHWPDPGTGVRPAPGADPPPPGPTPRLSPLSSTQAAPVQHRLWLLLRRPVSVICNHRYWIGRVILTLQNMKHSFYHFQNQNSLKYSKNSSKYGLCFVAKVLKYEQESFIKLNLSVLVPNYHNKEMWLRHWSTSLFMF